MEAQQGILSESISLMDTQSPSEDPMADDVVVREGMELFAMVNPPISARIGIGKHATLDGMFSATTNTPLEGTLMVENKNTSSGTTVSYKIDAFVDVSDEHHQAYGGGGGGGTRAQSQVRIYRPSKVEWISWARMTKSGSRDVTVFRPLDPSDSGIRTVVGDLQCNSPHMWESSGCRDSCFTAACLMVNGHLTMHAGTSEETVIPVSSDNNEGVRGADGTLVCAYDRVAANVSKAGKVTWTARTCGVVVQGFEHLRQAAIMTDIILYYMNPYASICDFNFVRPSPWQLETPEWQAVLRQPNVESLLNMTKVPVTKTGMLRLEFALRMYVACTVNKLVTLGGEGSSVSVHGEWLERAQALIKLVPSGGVDGTCPCPCPRSLSEIVSMWELFFAAYTQAVDGAESSVSLVPIKHPRELDYAQGALGKIIIMELVPDRTRPLFCLARFSFMTDRCMDDGHLPMFRDDHYFPVDPETNRVFMFGETSAEPAYKKHRCA